MNLLKKKLELFRKFRLSLEKIENKMIIDKKVL